MTKTKRLFIGVVLAGALIALWGHSAPSAKDREDIAKMTGRMNTWCVGRHLIDLPEAAGEPYLIQKFRWYDLSTWEATREQFDEEVGKRRKEIQEKVEDRSEDHWTLREDVLPEKKGVIFIFGGQVFDDRDFKLEGWVYLRNRIYHFKPNVFPETAIPNELAHLRHILTTLQHRPSNYIPKEPGFCIQNGFIPDDGKEFQLETTRIGMQFISNPKDVGLDISLIPRTLEKRDGLFGRLDAGKLLNEASEFFSRRKNLRKSTREAGGMEGEEVLDSLPAENGSGRNHLFAWEYSGQYRNLSHPIISVMMQTGLNENQISANPSLLTDTQAMALFDRIIDTIRLRPTGEQAKLPDQSYKIPLGMQISSRDICLQTGIWECAEPVLAYGKRQRRFEAGNRMPVVVVWGEPYSSKWRKWLGLKEEDPVETTWTLVAYDEPPQG